MVDYSKWDKLDISDDEAPSKPQVHRFDGPQTVTIGGQGSAGSVQVQPQATGERQGAAGADDGGEDDGDEPIECDDEAARGPPGEDRREDVLQCRALAESALRRGDAAEAVRLLEKAARLGGAACPGLADVLGRARELAAAGGAPAAGGEPGLAGRRPQTPDPASGACVGDRYAWSQTKDSVELGVFVEEGTRAKDVAVEVSETAVRIGVRGTTLLQGEWEYKVVPEEDPDWEMGPLRGRRAVRLTVKKAALPGGMSIVVWWRRALKGEPAIDVSKIQGRKPGASDSFAKAWNEAHVQFRERVANRKPVPVHLGAGGESDPCDVDG